MENKDQKSDPSLHPSAQTNAAPNSGSTAERTLDVDLQLKLEKELQTMTVSQENYSRMLAQIVVSSALAFLVVIVSVVFSFLPYFNQTKNGKTAEWIFPGFSLSFATANLIQIIASVIQIVSLVIAVLSFRENIRDVKSKAESKSN